jgi:hypothetical protein
MIDSTGSVRDEVATKTVDFRKGAERRAAPMARQPAYPFSDSIKVKTRDFRLLPTVQPIERCPAPQDRHGAESARAGSRRGKQALAALADTIHLVQHLIVLLHIRLERLLVKATPSSASAHSASGWRGQALHELHS